MVMKIFGLEKLSLVDFGSLSCAVVFTGGCNFICPFCHNSGLVTQSVEPLNETEVLEYLRKRFGLLEGVVVSGGEPTLQSDLPDFLLKLKKLGYKVKLDTNGTNPTMLQYVIDNKLVDYVAMDIKNSFDKYPLTTGIKKVDLDKISKSIEILKTSGIDYEFRTTLIAEYHEEKDILKIAELLKDAKKLYLQKFVSSDTCFLKNLSPVPLNNAEQFKNILNKSISHVYLRGYV